MIPHSAVQYEATTIPCRPTAPDIHVDLIPEGNDESVHKFSVVKKRKTHILNNNFSLNGSTILNLDSPLLLLIYKCLASTSASLPD